MKIRPHRIIKGEMQYFTELAGNNEEVAPTRFEFVSSRDKGYLFLFQFQDRKMCYNIQKLEMDYYKQREDDYFETYHAGLEIKVIHFSLQHIVKQDIGCQIVTFKFEIPTYHGYYDLKCFAHGFFNGDLLLESRINNGGVLEYDGLKFYPLKIS